MHLFKINLKNYLVFSYNCTIKNLLIKDIPGNKNSCRYKIPCSTCSSYYVGQTGASLETRVSQHKGYVRLGDENKTIVYIYKIQTNSISTGISYEVCKYIYQ